MLIEIEGRRADLPVEGVHAITSKTGKKYYYIRDRQKGKRQRLNTDGGIVEFMRSYEDLKKGIKKDLNWLISEYQESAEFRNLREKSKKTYLSYFREITVRFGDYSFAELEAGDFRGEVLKWRDRLYHKKAKADFMVGLISTLLSWGKNRRLISINHLSGSGKIYKADRSNMVWTADDLIFFDKNAALKLRHVFFLTYFTGQRIGDILKLTWDCIFTNENGDRFILITQEKTGARVRIFINEPLSRILENLARHKKSARVLSDFSDNDWDYDDFNARAAAIIRRGKKPLHIHDLRGTFMSDLKDIGLTPAQIATISGHTTAKGSAVVQGYLSKNITEDMINASNNLSKDIMILHEKVLIRKGCFIDFLKDF